MKRSEETQADNLMKPPLDRPFDLAVFLLWVNNCLSDKEWTNWRHVRQDSKARITRKSIEMLIAGHLVPARRIGDKIYIQAPQGQSPSREMSHARTLYNSQQFERIDRFHVLD